MRVTKGRTGHRPPRAEPLDPPDPIAVMMLAMAGITVAFLGAVLVAVGVLPPDVALWAVVVAVPGRFVVGFQDLRRAADAFTIAAAIALAARLIEMFIRS